MPGSDDANLLHRRLGLVDGDPAEVPWTRRYPSVGGTLVIVQPGLGAQRLRAELAADPIPPGAHSLRELFSVLADTALSDGAELVLVVSP